MVTRVCTVNWGDVGKTGIQIQLQIQIQIQKKMWMFNCASLLYLLYVDLKKSGLKIVVLLKKSKKVQSLIQCLNISARM